MTETPTEESRVEKKSLVQHEDSTSDYEAEEDFREDIEQYVKPEKKKNTLYSIFCCFQQFLNKYWKLKALVIYFIIFMDALSFTLVEPMLPAMLQKRMGIQEQFLGTYAGMVLGAYSAAQFLTTPFFGHLSDVFGRRMFMVVSLLGSTFCVSIFGFITNVYVAIGVRFIQGFFNALSALCKAYLVDMSMDDSKQAIMLIVHMGAIQGLSRSVSAGIGPISLGILEHTKGLNNPFFIPCVVSGGLMGIALLLALNLSERNKTEEEKALKTSFFKGIMVICADKRVAINVLNLCLNYFSNHGNYLLLVLIVTAPIKTYGLSLTQWESGIIFILFGVVGLIFQLLALERTIMSFGLRRTYFVGGVCNVIQVILLGLSPAPLYYYGESTKTVILTYLILALVCLLCGISKILCLPVLQCILTNVTDNDKQGLVYGMTRSLTVIAKTMGSVATGMMLSAVGFFNIPRFYCFVFVGITFGFSTVLGIMQSESVERSKEENSRLQRIKEQRRAEQKAAAEKSAKAEKKTAEAIADAQNSEGQAAEVSAVSVEDEEKTSEETKKEQ